MRKILPIIFTLFLCFNFINCASTNLPTQIINIDEKPDSEFVIDATRLKGTIEAKFVLEKATGSGVTYKAEKTEVLQIFTINPKDIIKIRFNAKELAHKLFIGESDFNMIGPRFSTGGGSIYGVTNLGFRGQSINIVFTKNGRRYTKCKMYKD